MKLYHYSVDSYQGAKQLTNDYKNNYRFAEPYILALRESREAFDAVFLATMYMSREIKALGLRKYENYQKDAVEGIFEYVRETEFPENTSRLRCVYYCETEQEALAYAKEDCFSDGLFTKDQVALLEVEVEDSSIRRYDQFYYNLALEAIKKHNIDSVFAYARKYYSCQRSDHPLIEVVADGSNTVLRTIAY
ncbi:MAG: hypothetical protein IJ719_17480 [Clostridia bacterium]|nr:hypothetical protein [Clostridia bacterium]